MIQFFVNKNIAVIVLMVIILAMGTMSYIDLPKEQFPEIKQPIISVFTPYSGVSTKDIENLVTRVIEDEIDGLEGVDEILSSSQQNSSNIVVKFTSDVSQEIALRRVKERVDIAKAKLPSDVDEPIIAERSTSDIPILITVLSNLKGLDVIDSDAERLQRAIERVNGVNEVNVNGRLKKEVAITLDPQKLEHYGLSIDNVINGIRNENRTIPGGNLKNNAKNYTLSVTGELKSLDEFYDIVIRKKEVAVPLSQIGEISFTWAEPESYSRINGEPCITLLTTKQAGKNIVDVVEEVKNAVAAMKREFPQGTEVRFVSDQSKFVHEMILDLENNIVTAFVLVLIVTIFFIGFRNAMFVAFAIPLSMLLSFTVLQFLGITLNMIVLFSLVLALGMLVDNGIVIVENIFRHGSTGKDKIQAAVDGASEVGWPIITSTVTTCLAFFPIIFMPGIIGEFMSYMPITIIVVLASSLFVALVINPVLCAMFLSLSKKNQEKLMEGSSLFGKVLWLYRKTVVFVTSHVGYSIMTVGISLVMLVAGVFVYNSRGKEQIFFPSSDPEVCTIDIETVFGTPLDTTDAYVKEIEKIIPQSPASMENYVATTGRGVSKSQVSSPKGYNKANVRIDYKTYLERDIPSPEAIDSIKNRLKTFVGAKVTVQEVKDGPETGHPISYEITGLDYAVIGQYAEYVREIISDYDCFQIVESDYEPAKPEVSIDVDRKKAAFYKLSTSEIASTIRKSISGGNVGKFHYQNEEYDIITRYREDQRNSFDHLKKLHIVNKDDERIPLSSIATIRTESSVAAIQRRNLRRAVQVWADFKEGFQKKDEIKKEISAAIAEIQLPEGYIIETGAGSKTQEESKIFLIKAFLVALSLIILVLIIQFNSVMQALIIMLTVLISYGGVFWGYFFLDMAFVVIMSGIGCIALAGVVVNNCIVLIDYTNLLIKQGYYWKEAIIEAGATRLRPVMLTAITTVLGMLPMALKVSFDIHTFKPQVGSESADMWVSFAWAIISGLSFATLSTLVIVPALLTISFSLNEGLKQLFKK